MTVLIILFTLKLIELIILNYHIKVKLILEMM
nr:MAG TPA: hypothetical protein [Podoviridae sp. ctY3D12]